MVIGSCDVVDFVMWLLLVGEYVFLFGMCYCYYVFKGCLMFVLGDVEVVVGEIIRLYDMVKNV